MKALLILCPLVVISCSTHEKRDEKVQEEVTTLALSDIHSTKMPKLAGTVSFENVSEGIKVKANLTGLPKKTTLGFHIHEMGACEGPDYKSAGEHFNPTEMQHGGPDHSKKHSGDLGNLVTDASGAAVYEIVIPKSANDDFEKIIGKSVLVHAKKDDFKTQPSGNSGARIACGIIKPMESSNKVSMVSNVFAEQGTMSTDDNEVSQGEASLSGTSDDIDLREEEVQLQEDETSPVDQPLEVNEAELEDLENEMEN